MKNLAACLALLCFFISSHAQKASSFDDFLKRLTNSDPDKRQGIVEQYLSQIKTTPLIEGRNKVHFIWYGKADTLKVEGDLQRSWAIPAALTKTECGDKDFFHISYDVPSTALLEYDFIADGKRIVDPRNTRITKGFDFGDRNIFAMPDFIESPYIKTRHGIDKGSVAQWTFKSSHKLFTNQPIWIYIPYEYSKEKTYPVLYVYDGMSVYNRPFVDVFNNLIYDGKIEPIVVVFVSFIDRWNDYVEKSDEHAQWVVDELVPFIEKNFRVATSPDKRGIIGASASGHAVMVAALRHPDVFGNVASQGGGAGGYPGLNPHANTALDDFLTKKDKYPLRTLYTEVGTFDLEFPRDKIVFSDGVKQFSDRLTKAGIPYIFKEVEGGHSSSLWDQNLDDILLLFFAGDKKEK